MEKLNCVYQACFYEVLGEEVADFELDWFGDVRVEAEERVGVEDEFAGREKRNDFPTVLL